MDRRIISATGLQNATGFSVQLPDVQTGDTREEKVPPQPLVLGALVLVIAGVIAGFIRLKPSTVIGGIAGLAAAGLLLMFKAKVDARVTEGAGMGLIQLVFEPGFWGALVLAALAGLLSLFGLQQGGANEPGQVAPPGK